MCAIFIFRVIAFVVVCFLHISSPYTFAAHVWKNACAYSRSRFDVCTVRRQHSATGQTPGAPTIPLSNIPIIPLLLIPGESRTHIDSSCTPAAKRWLNTTQFMSRSLNRKRIQSESHFKSKTINKYTELQRNNNNNNNHQYQVTIYYSAFISGDVCECVWCNGAYVNIQHMFIR